MTNEHPITPPPELVAKLWREASAGRDDAPIGEIFNHGVYLAYCAGAACRPKPPSLKEQALEQCNDYIDPDGIIRRALERLPN